MRTKNTYYVNKDDFTAFVRLNKFENEKNIFIQVFSSVLEKDKLTQVVDDILNILPQARLIGATTDGEILDNVVTTDKIVVSVTAFENATLSVASLEHTTDSFTTGVELATKLLKKDTKALFMFVDGLNTNGEMFLNGVQSITKNLPIAGGLAGDAAHFDRTYVFSNDKIISSGAVGISVNTEKLNVKTAYSFNWQEIGKVLTITKAQDNRVYEIDGISAVNVYAKYLGEDVADLLPAIGIEFPLIINRNGMKIARAVLGKELDGSLIFAGNVHVGDKVQFGYGNSGMILGEALKTKERIVLPCVESIFVYSCMARRRFLNDAIAVELTPLAHVAPTAGFFTYGEFFTNGTFCDASQKNDCELLNQTMTILSMSESDAIQKYVFEDKSYRNNTSELNATNSALSHLIRETSRELEEINLNLENMVEEKTKELSQKVEELERLSRVKSEFLASMSHEIRTPLNAILGFVDILRAGEKDKERQKRFSIIKNSGATLLTVINDILDFSKIESGNMLLERRKFATKKPFKETSQLLYEKAIENGVELKVHFDENLPRYFVGDIIRIKQVVSNFLSNAIKFTPKGGTVSVFLNYDTNKDELKFSVKDTGIGIEEKNIEKIFHSFTQEDSSTTRRFGGTGLGLSISKALIEAMQGSIGVESIIGKGSIFSFVLPLLEPEASDMDEETAVGKIDLTKSLDGNILLVEDNKTNQMLMQVLLGNLDLDVDLAENGLEAVKKFEENKYDLILMDENMPKMSGIEATTIILELEKKSGAKHTPIIALTANALATDRARFLDAGMDEFVSKPIDYEVFIRMLHSYLL